MPLSENSEQRGNATGLANTLAPRKTIYIRQKRRMKRECLEMLTGCEFENRFTVEDTEGSNLLFKMKESSSCIKRQCFPQCYPFDMNVLTPDAEWDAEGGELVRMHRDFQCTNVQAACPCAHMCSFTLCFGAQRLEMMNPQGELIGSVTEEPWTWCCNGKWAVRDDTDAIAFNYDVSFGMLCAQCCCKDVEMPIMRAGQTEPAALLKRKFICKLWNLLLDLDEFQVDYIDESLTPTEKMMLMSTSVLMKYVYFEEGKDNGGG